MNLLAVFSLECWTIGSTFHDTGKGNSLRVVSAVPFHPKDLRLRSIA